MSTMSSGSRRRRPPTKKAFIWKGNIEQSLCLEAPFVHPFKPEVEYINLLNKVKYSAVYILCFQWLEIKAEIMIVRIEFCIMRISYLRGSGGGENTQASLPVPMQSL